MGSREDHAPELGPRGFIDPVVTAQPVSPSSLTEGMPVIHLSSVPPVSSSSPVPGVDPPSCARPMGSVEGNPNPLFEAAEAVLRATDPSSLRPSGRQRDAAVATDIAHKDRRTGSSRRQADTHGGFYFHPRSAFRAAGHTLLSGSKRSCIPDCTSMLLHQYFQFVLPVGAFDDIYVVDRDPSFRDVDRVLLPHGFCPRSRDFLLHATWWH